MNNQTKTKKLYTVESLKKLTIVSRDEGSILGHVSQVFINPETKTLSSFLIKEAYWSNAYKKVDAKFIEDVGEDILIIDSESNCVPVEDLSSVPGLSMNNIEGHGVITNDGRYLGELTDMSFTQGSWEIFELYMSKDMVLPISGEVIIIGEDEILVPSLCANKVYRTENTAAWGKILNNERAGINKRLNSYKTSKASNKSPNSTIN